MSTFNPSITATDIMQGGLTVIVAGAVSGQPPLVGAGAIMVVGGAIADGVAPIIQDALAEDPPPFPIPEIPPRTGGRQALPPFEDPVANPYIEGPGAIAGGIMIGLLA